MGKKEQVPAMKKGMPMGREPQIKNNGTPKPKGQKKGGAKC